MLFVLSIWNLSFLRGWRDMIFASPGDRFFMPLPQTVDYVALLILVSGGAAISFFVLRGIRYYAAGFENILFLIFTAAISIGFGDYLRGAIGGGRIAVYLLAGLAPVLLGLILWHRSRVLLARAIFIAGLVTVPFAFSNLLQAGWHIVFPNPNGVDADAAGQSTKTAPEPRQQLAEGAAVAGRHRVVWLVFDELDERALFGEQRSGYEFETFDQFRAQSMHFTRATGIGGLTIYAMPGYWLGTRVIKSNTVDDDGLDVTLQGSNSAVPFGDLNHLFRTTQEAKLHTALVGYYLPYCRMFEGLYDSCETYYYIFDPRIAESRDLGEALAAQISVFNPLWFRLSKMEEFQRSATAAMAVAADPRFDLVAIHAGFPHSPWVFDAKRKQFSLSKSNYLDSIGSADHYLALVRQAMLDAGIWDESAIIITADEGNRLWQGEDVHTLGAVPFLVKLPHQRRGRDISCNLDVIVLKSLIEGLLRGHVPSDQRFESCLL
jgi:hypothetical protein